MRDRKEEDPQEIAVAFHAFAARVPDEPLASQQVSCVAERDVSIVVIVVGDEEPDENSSGDDDAPSEPSGG